MTKSEKTVQMILWGAAVLLGGYLGARGFLKLRENPSEKSREILKMAYGAVEEECIAWYLPGSLYEEGKSQTFLARVWEQVGAEFPLFTYLKENKTVEPVIEDESTCHEIIEANGKTITERLLAENQGQAVREENEAVRAKSREEAGKCVADGAQQGITAGEGMDAEEESQPEMPAWTTAVEAPSTKDLSMEQLSDFNYLLNNFFVVDPNTTIDSSQMDAASLLGDDLTMKGDNSSPQILIYHTHSQEGYIDSIKGDENTSVIGVGNYLESILRDVYGYQVLHIKETFDLMGGELDRSEAYTYALPVLEQVLAENPSIEVVIDLHRDGVDEDKHLVTEINGKPTAQVMFFNGLSRTVNNGSLDSLPNPYISDNLAFSFQLSYQAAKYYPHFTRCIYLKGYRYNLHVRPKSILLEVGAQTNTVQEAMNAMEPFSVILNKVLKGE